MANQTAYARLGTGDELLEDGVRIGLKVRVEPLHGAAQRCDARRDDPLRVRLHPRGREGRGP